MPQCSSVVRVKSRPIPTDSGEGLSGQLAEGCVIAEPFIIGTAPAGAGLDSRAWLKWLVPAGPLGARSQSWLTLMTSVVTGEAARCAVIGFPSVFLISASLAHLVRRQRKRYHPLYTLQAQGRMHVQMKVPSHVRIVRRLRREEQQTGFLEDYLVGGLA
jgi:hypothetical protein